MPKSKYAPALFEVIQGQQEKRPGKFQLPKWWRTNKLTPASTTAVAEPEPSAVEPIRIEAPIQAPVAAVVESAAVQPIERPWQAEDVARESGEYFAQITIGQKTLAMSTVGATVVLGVLIVVLGVSFGLGSLWGRSGSKTTVASNSPDEVELAVSKPPNPAVLKVTPPPVAMGKLTESAKAASPKPVTAPPAAKSAPPPAAAADSTKKTEGQTHVLLETFKEEHKASAEFAQQWLQKKKIATTIEKKGNRWRLISADGFDYGRPEETQRAQQYMESMKAYGKSMSSDMSHAGLPNYLMSKPAAERMDH